jgi:uroporphyrinogen decarboxylase
MNPKQRILNFINHKPVDQVPFMPIFMQFCARYGKVKYRDFILDIEQHCQANITTARAFDSVWVNVMSDPYGELEAYGAHIEYPEDSLPMDKIILFPELSDLDKLKVIDFTKNYRTNGRIEIIRRFKELVDNEFLITGWVEGPIAEYCDLRSMSNAFLDFFDAPDKVAKTIQIILENAKNFITLQVAAGAHCIGIGDAAASQVGRDLYLEYAFDGEKMLVDHIHSLGAVAKLHICGNTEAIIPDMIKTGADIIDIDHLVKDMSPYCPMLGEHQVFCGNLDPVSIIQNGDFNAIRSAFNQLPAQYKNRLVISGGCEITPDTPVQNLNFLRNLIENYN